MKHTIEGIDLSIWLTDSSCIEIPLEPWQVEVISRVLGLGIVPLNRNEYETTMFSKDTVNELMTHFPKLVVKDNE